MAISPITEPIPSWKIIHKTKVDFVNRGIFNPIYLVQDDESMPVLEVTLYKGGVLYSLPSDIELDVYIRLKKPDGTFISETAFGCNDTRDTVYFNITAQMTYFSGKIMPILQIVYEHGSAPHGAYVAGSSPVLFLIDRNPVGTPSMESTTEWEEIQRALQAASEIESMYEEIEEDIEIIHSVVDVIDLNSENIIRLFSIVDSLTGYISNDNMVIDSFEDTSHITLISGVYDEENNRLIS